MASYHIIDENTRIRHGYYFPALWTAYTLQRKRRFLWFFYYWKVTSWTYHTSIRGGNIHDDLQDMIDWMYWDEKRKGYYTPYF